jgi:hypothetical protein
MSRRDRWTRDRCEVSAQLLARADAPRSGAYGLILQGAAIRLLQASDGNPESITWPTEGEASAELAALQARASTISHAEIERWRTSVFLRHELSASA